MAIGLDNLRIFLSIISTTVYIAVGWAVGQRDISRESKPANRSFQTWWFGLAAITMLNPTMLVIDKMEAGTGQSYFQARLFLYEAILIAIIVAVGCLVYYLLYVYFGRSGVLWPVAAYHFLLLAWLMFLVTWGHPTRYGARCESSNWCYERPFSGTPANTWLLLSIVVPILLSAIAYFALFFRVEDRAQKYRILLVGGGLIGWFGVVLVAGLVKGDFLTTAGDVRHVALSQWIYWTYVISPTISLVAASLIFVAYRPPRWVRVRLQGSAG